MGKGSNTFKKAIRHLKSNQIDEKLQLLSEIPTNNTSGVYVVEPEYQVQDPDVPGAEPADFTQDNPTLNGRDTTGLFSEDGTILTIEPPDELGNKSFILGPMASMWYGWGNFTTIGYIRQSDRRMVDLGRITGRLGSWNGTNNFTSYGQLTIEQARWFRDTPKLNGANNDTPNYRAFYPGPPSNAPDQYGRYLCVITGTPKPTSYTPPPRRIPPGMGGFDPNLPPGSANPYLTDKPVPPDILGDLAILGLSAAAVVALGYALASGAATALLSRLRYLAKLRMDRGALNPFGQTAVRSGAAGRQRVDVYTGRPYQGPRGNRTGTQYGTVNRQTANTYTNPGPLRGTPGTGARTNPAGSLDKGTLPQRYIDKYGSRSVLGQQQVKMSPSAARRTFGESLNESSDVKGDYANAFVLKLFSDHSDPYDKIDEIIKIIEKHLKTKNNKIKESFDNSNTRKIIREIKKPYVLPEQPKVKYKIKPRSSRTINVDLMKKAEVPSSFKKAEDRMWGKYEWKQNVRASQERKNEVLDHLGGSDHAWEWLTETSRKKNNKIMYGNFGNGEKEYEVVRKEELKGDTLLFIVDENGRKESILQSELSCRIADEFNKELFEKYFKEQETAQVDNDPLFKKVSKRLKKEIDYPDKPAKKGYPNDPPPEMINGWHPKFGDRADYYNKLDPQSADFMPSTENPEIDIKVEKSKSKKFKVKEETKINWKKDISKHKKHYMEGKVVQEGMTSSGVFSTTLPATGDTDLSSIDAANPETYSTLSNVDLGSESFFSLYGGLGNVLSLSSYKVNPYASLNAIDTTFVDTISLTGVAGNLQAGSLPTNSDLLLLWYNPDNGQFGEFVAIPKTATSLSTYNITLPPEARGKNVEFFVFQERSSQDAGKDFIGLSIPIGNEYAEITDNNDGLIASLLINYNGTDTDAIYWGKLIMSNVSRNNQNFYYPGYAGPVSGNAGDPNIDGLNGDLTILKNNNSGAFTSGFLSGKTLQQLQTQFGDTNLNTSQVYSDLQSISYYDNLIDYYNDQILYGNPSLKSYYQGLYNSAISSRAALFTQLQGRINSASPLPDSRWTDADYKKVTNDIYLLKGSASYAITRFSTKRRTPQNVFVSLDSPEATAFIRTEPNLSNLSPQEKQQKLKEMLEASDEYLEKILGPEFPGTGAVPPGESSETPGVEIAQLYPADYDRERAVDQMLLKGLQRGDYGTGPDIDRQIRQIQQNLQKGTPGGLPQASMGQDTQIAQMLPAQQQRGATGVGVPDTTGTSPGSNPPPSSQMNYPKEWLPKQAQQARMPMVASYEPQGQLISEKRKLKSPQEILDKIPGYYDGKPAPLGFPVEKPPEMVNGMHSDLVDGKKVANRFNRLDPESAKAMPPTGNPHIDKKVKAAQKKPK